MPEQPLTADEIIRQAEDDALAAIAAFKAAAGGGGRGGRGGFGSGATVTITE